MTKDYMHILISTIARRIDRNIGEQLNLFDRLMLASILKQYGGPCSNFAETTSSMLNDYATLPLSFHDGILAVGIWKSIIREDSAICDVRPEELDNHLYLSLIGRAFSLPFATSGEVTFHSVGLFLIHAWEASSGIYHYAITELLIALLDDMHRMLLIKGSLVTPALKESYITSLYRIATFALDRSIYPTQARTVIEQLDSRFGRKLSDRHYRKLISFCFEKTIPLNPDGSSTLIEPSGELIYDLILYGFGKELIGAPRLPIFTQSGQQCQHLSNKSLLGIIYYNFISNESH